MLEVEPYLVQLITQVAKMRIPITVLLWAFNLPTQLLKGPRLGQIKSMEREAQHTLSNT